MAADPPQPAQASLQPLTEKGSEPPGSNVESNEKLPCGRLHCHHANPEKKMQVDPATDLLNSMDDQEKVLTTAYPALLWKDFRLYNLQTLQVSVFITDSQIDCDIFFEGRFMI